MAHHEKIKQQLFMNVGDRIDLLTTKAILISNFAFLRRRIKSVSAVTLWTSEFSYILCLHISQFSTQLNIRTITALEVTCF